MPMGSGKHHLLLIQEAREKGKFLSLSLGQLVLTDFLQGAVPVVWVLLRNLDKVVSVKGAVISYKMII